MQYTWQILDPRTGQRSLPATGNAGELIDFAIKARTRQAEEHKASGSKETLVEHMIIMLFEQNEENDEAHISRVPLMQFSNFLRYMEETNNIMKVAS